jgi:hypothetical protein
MKAETHRYIGKYGESYQFDITHGEVAGEIQVVRKVNDKFKSAETYRKDEYSFIRQIITDNMAAIGATRRW